MRLRECENKIQNRVKFKLRIGHLQNIAWCLKQKEGQGTSSFSYCSLRIFCLPPLPGSPGFSSAFWKAERPTQLEKGRLLNSACLHALWGMGNMGEKTDGIFLSLFDLAVLSVGRILLCLLSKLSLGLTEKEEIWNTQIDDHFSNRDWLAISHTWKKLGVRAQENKKPWALFPALPLTHRLIATRSCSCTATTRFPGWETGTISDTTASVFPDLHQGSIWKRL